MTDDDYGGMSIVRSNVDGFDVNISLGSYSTARVETYRAVRLDLKRVSPAESDDESYQRNERVMLAAAAEVERLKPIVGAPVGEPGETLTVAWAGDFREEDVDLERWPIVPRGGQHVGTPTGVIAIHRPTGVAAICENERSQWKNRQDALIQLRKLVQPTAVSPGTLTPAEWSALEELRRTCEANADDVGYYSVPDNQRRFVVSALAKLREQAGGR